MFALSSECARSLVRLFEAREVEKRYLAVVRGFTDTEGRIDYALLEEPGRERQPAVTDYRCLARTEIPEPVGRYGTARYSLLEISPRTGRMHQIRKHMKHIFHPVVGDTTHGDGRQNDLFRRRFRMRRLLLWAVELGFDHPFTGRRVRIEAPPGAEFTNLDQAIGWEPVRRQ